MADQIHAPLTRELLKAYSAAALANATSLLEEARLLLQHGHRARAYFLAVASIEEVGKSVLAFDGCGRHLKDPAVVTRLRRSFEDHAAKIRTAFAPWIQRSADVRKAVQVGVDLIVALRQGREPAMYTDFSSDSDGVQRPLDVVREVAAKDSVRLAADCLAQAQAHLESGEPSQKAKEDDQLFTMKSSDLHAITGSEDFWWYYVSRVEAGESSWSLAVVSYRNNFLLKDVKFEASSGDA